MKEEIIQNINQGLEAAYINGNLASNLEYKPSFISNNPEEGKKVISSIEEELLRCEQFQISVAFITMGGITPLLQTLKELERKGIPGQILTTNYLDFSEPRALAKLNEMKNITLKMYDVEAADNGFHTKGYIFKKEEVYRIILGSSNMTSAALTSNIEWNTKIISTEQGEVASEIVKEFNSFWKSEYALNEGIDIVEVNQVIMLRPTQSPIVFIQQLGRGLRKAEGKEYVVILDFIGNYNNNFMIPVALSGDNTYNADVIRKYVISGNSTIPGASTIHFDEIAKEKIFHAIDCIKPSTLKELMKEGYVNLKNRLGRRPMLLDFYENAEMDPLVIVKEYKTYYSFAEQMEKKEQLFRLSEQEKTTLEYLSKTILSGVRPDELEILRLFLEKNQITYSEVIDSCKERYGYEITTQKIDLACDVLKGKFVTNSTEREKFYQIDILEADGENRLKRILSYTERLAHKDFYDQVQDIVAVGLARYQDKYAKPYRNGVPFVLYEKYSRRDVSLLMNAGKDLSSTMYGMSQLGDDVFIFVTYHKEENTDEEKEYVDGKPDYADEFVDNVIFRWDSQIDKKLDGAYMDKVLNTPRKHLFVQKTDAENNFFYMGEFDVLEAHEAEKKNNRGVLKPICKLKFKMQTAVREDLLRYLQSGKTMEEK